MDLRMYDIIRRHYKYSILHSTYDIEYDIQYDIAYDIV